MKLPEFIVQINEKWYCYLDSDASEDAFELQCKKCELSSVCSGVRSIYKRIPGDWHAKNAEAFFGKLFLDEKDPKRRKKLRKKAKVGGLALVYGCSGAKLAVLCDLQEAEGYTARDSFFALLSDLNRYMRTQKSGVLQTGTVTNLFGRVRDVSKFSHPDSSLTKDEVRRKQSFAQRTALNGPIQGTAASILKFAMYRVDQMVLNEGLSPFAGQTIPQKINFNEVSYSDLVLQPLMSVHDEIVFQMLENKVDDIMPELYETMQVKDIINAFGLGFDLELDVEFDPTGTWTATKAYSAALIYLKLFLKNETNGGIEEKPNTILIDFNQVDQSFLSKLEQRSASWDFNKREQEGAFIEDPTYHLGVETEGLVYFNKFKISIAEVKCLNILYELVHIKGL